MVSGERTDSKYALDRNILGSMYASNVLYASACRNTLYLLVLVYSQLLVLILPVFSRSFTMLVYVSFLVWFKRYFATP